MGRHKKNIDEVDVLQGIRAKIQQAEDARKAKPSRGDIQDTIQLLKDFHITIKKSDIPEFNTVAELKRWRTKYIKENL